MSRFNTRTTVPLVRSPLVTEATPSGRTGEGAPGYAKEDKTELFLLAVSNMVGRDEFYETGPDRDSRYQALVRRVAVTDPEWTAGFLGWLRSAGNMRSASLVGALEAAHAMLEAKVPGGRKIVSSVLQRADEPGEALAYWMSRHGRTIPASVKRGVADAALRLYSEYAALKYDTASHAVRFGDVAELTHPGDRNANQRFRGAWQQDLFRFLIGVRHNRAQDIPESLAMWRAQTELRRDVVGTPGLLLDTAALKAAGMTWEDALSLAGPGVDKAKLWEALIPTMGYMALLRNLRNFDQAGVSDEIAATVAARLADPEAVRQSRQFPFRFYAAHTAVASLRWGHALEKALTASLDNVPSLGGRTLILVDQSPSMFPGYWFSTDPARSDMVNADVAKLFGSAIALRAADATLVGYGQDNYRVPVQRGGSVLRLMEQFQMRDGTDAYGAAADHYVDHDRIVVVTDGENNGRRFTSFDQAGVPARVPIYTWDIAGLKHTQAPTGKNRYLFGGMTDAAFRMVSLLEAGRDAIWPWLEGDR